MFNWITELIIKINYQPFVCLFNASMISDCLQEKNLNSFNKILQKLFVSLISSFWRSSHFLLLCQSLTLFCPLVLFWDWVSILYPAWPWTCSWSTSASQVLRLQMWSTQTHSFALCFFFWLSSASPLCLLTSYLKVQYKLANFPYQELIGTQIWWSAFLTYRKL